MEPVRHDAAGHPLDGHGKVDIDMWRAGHGVTAQRLLAIDAHAHRAVLAGTVGEQIAEIVGDREHIGSSIDCLLHDTEHAQRVKAVLPDNAHRGKPKTRSATMLR